MNPSNQYNRLLKEIKDWCGEAKHRHKTGMWSYPKNKLDDRWSLHDLYERVAAAKQIGYDVMLEANDEGISVFYMKQIPEIPYEWK